MAERMRTLLATADRYRAMAGTITDRIIAQRLLDYADELSAKARRLARDGMGEEGSG